MCEVFFSAHYDAAADQTAARALDASGIRSVLFRCTMVRERTGPTNVEMLADVGALPLTASKTLVGLADSGAWARPSGTSPG